MTEEWPTRPAAHLFYAQEKAEIERRSHESEPSGLDLYLLRPPIVLGPHAVGGKSFLPERSRLGAPPRRRSSAAARAAARARRRLPLQFIHEDDVGQAFLQCIVGAGPPGAYNITGDGVLTGADVARELGLAALPVPARARAAPRRGAQSLPTAVPPARRRVGRGGDAAVDHGHEQGQARARLAAALHGLEALRDTIAAR